MPGVPFRLLLSACLFAVPASAAERKSDPAAVATSIDRAIDARLKTAKVVAAPAADDATFLRRASLDITGRVPTAERAVAFLDSKDPAKRRLLIDELLARSAYGEHFAILWADLLTAPDTVTAAEKTLFRTWLAEGFNAGRGWDALVRDMLTVEGRTGPAAFTIAASDNGRVMPNLLAAATTRHFLGIQLQCAECHKHPFTDWKQDDFWGVAAFFAQVRNDKAGKTPAGVTETAPMMAKGKPTKQTGSIAIPNTAGKAAGRLVKARFLDGGEPTLPTEGAYRPALADWVTGPENPYFARAAVNRLWAHFHGRGLVNPIDDQHSGNQPSHPALLTLLADEFRASGYDLKHLIRCVCQANVYQRSGRPVSGNADDAELFSRMAAKVISPDSLYDALCGATGLDKLNVSAGKDAADSGRARKGGAETPRDRFVRLFRTRDTDSAATDYTHGIPQALGLMNDPQFNQATPLIARLVREGLPRERAVEQLYLSALARRPTADELRRVGLYLDGQKDAARGYQGVQWALINSPEFILNR